MSMFFEKSIKPKRHFEILGVYTSIEKKCENCFEFLGESHPFWELLYVKKGMLEVVEDENTYVLYEGSIICHAPGEFHRIRNIGEASAHILVLTLDTIGALPDNVKNGVFALTKELRELFEESFRSLFYMCYEKGRTKSPHAQVCSSDVDAAPENLGNPNKVGEEGLASLTVFLWKLSKQKVNDTLISTDRRAREYSKIVSTMSDNISENLSIDEISALHHVSKSYVTKLFKAYAGEGPMKYYARLRLTKIQNMLLSGIGISKIVEDMNFSSAAYLSSFFKEKTGLSPMEWLGRAKVRE